MKILFPKNGVETMGYTNPHPEMNLSFFSYNSIQCLKSYLDQIEKEIKGLQAEKKKSK